MSKGWFAVPLALGLVVAACNGDDDATPAPDPATEAPAAVTAAPVVTDAPADPTDAPADPTDAPADEGDAGAAGGQVLVFDGEQIAIDRMLCFFEEQPRAGLGGVFTHTAQGSGTNAAGDPVLLDVSRARDEDGTVGDDILVDIGEPGADDAVGYRAVGPEGTVTFGESSVTATDLEMTSFELEPVTASFDLSCG